jgi:hypothetical protein
MWIRLASRFSFESGYCVKVLAIIHALIGATLFAITLLVNPTILLCSGIPYASFQLFLLSWWLWRFPRIDSFRTRILPISLRRQPMTEEQEAQLLQRAWRFQLVFVNLWGWICTVLLGTLANWWMLWGGCPWASILLLGGVLLGVAGWILGSAWIVHHVYKE